MLQEKFNSKKNVKYQKNYGVDENLYEEKFKIRSDEVAIGSQDIEYIFINFKVIEEIMLNDLASIKIINDQRNHHERYLTKSEIIESQQIWNKFISQKAYSFICLTDGKIIEINNQMSKTLETMSISQFSLIDK